MKIKTGQKVLALLPGGELTATVVAAIVRDAIGRPLLQLQGGARVRPSCVFAAYS